MKNLFKTNLSVNESLDEASVNKKLKNIQFFSAFRRNKNEANFDQLM